MSDENLQGKTVVSEYSAGYNPYAGLGKRQALLMDAYLTERNEWETAKEEVKSTIYDTVEELNKAYEDSKKDSKVTKFLYNKLLRKPTPAEQRVQEAKEVLQTLTNRMQSVLDNEPKPDMYEIAMLGNNLFKPR